MSSTKDSVIIWVSENKNAIGVLPEQEIVEAVERGRVYMLIKFRISPLAEV